MSRATAPCEPIGERRAERPHAARRAAVHSEPSGGALLAPHTPHSAARAERRAAT